MRPASQNIRFIILFLYLMISGCSHFTPENKPNPSTQNEVKQSFFSNGNLEYEVEYVNGKLDGVSKVWLEDGTLYSISKYSNNQPHGIWEKFHSNGKLMFEINYEYGKKYGVPTPGGAEVLICACTVLEDAICRSGLAGVWAVEQN